MPYNPDELFEKIVMKTSAWWGPFYALYYLVRLIARELFRRQ
jgi:hypothetical protein